MTSGLIPSYGGTPENPARPGTLTITVDLAYSQEAEQRAIGLVLQWPETWGAFSTLTEADFFNQYHSSIWKCIMELRAAKLPCNIEAVLSQMASKWGVTMDSVQVLGLFTYLSGVITSIYSHTGYEDTAKLLLMKSARRDLAFAYADGAEKLNKALLTQTAAMLASDHITRIQKGQKSSSMIGAGALVRQIKESLDKPVHLTPTGFPRLDKALAGGFVRSSYNVFAARMKSFKTTTAVSIAYNMIVSDNPARIDYYCLESTAEQVFKKMLTRWMSEVWSVREGYGVMWNTLHFRDRNITGTPEFRAALDDAEKFFDNRGLRFLTKPRMTLEELKNEVTTSGLRGETDGVFVDYSQLIRSPLSDRAQTTAHLDDVHQTMAELAANNPLWIVGLAQLNPGKGVRGGDGAAQAVTTLINIHKVEEEPEEGRGDNSPIKKAWFEIKEARDLPEVNIGGDGKTALDDDGQPIMENGRPKTNPEPAYLFEKDVGPYLKELPCPIARQEEVEMARRSR